MLEDCATSAQHKTVLRLAAIARQTLQTIMSRRRIDPREHAAIADALRGTSMALSAETVVDDAFRARQDKPTPFPVRRFGDGSMGVYYSALEERTCKREVGYHLGRELAETRTAGFTHPRRYAFVRCEYDGNTAELRGKEGEHPDLVSQTRDGYPFCQALAREATSNGIAGLLTRSARDPRGTCLPVFERGALSNPEATHSVKAHAGPKGIRFLRT